MFVPKSLNHKGSQSRHLSTLKVHFGNSKVNVRGFASHGTKYNHCIVPLNLNAHSENDGFLKEACKHTLSKLFITLHISPIKTENHFDRLMDIMDTYYNICQEIALKGHRLTMESRIVIPNLGGNVTALLHAPDLEAIFQHGLHFHEGLLNSERGLRNMKPVTFIQMPGKENKKGLPKIKSAGAPFKAYESVAVQGVFDHLSNVHNDMRILHAACFRAKRRLVVALPPPKDNEKFPELMQSVADRKAGVEYFLNLVKPPNLRIEVVPYTKTGIPEKCNISDDSHKVDAMVCEEFPEDIAACKQVNEMRVKHNLGPMEIYQVKAAKARFTSADMREWLSKRPR